MQLHRIAQLASNKWRSRFGRPTKVDTLGEVVGGAYCKMPEDWLQRKIGNDDSFYYYFYNFMFSSPHTFCHYFLKH
jgi:hypothetical protein